MKWFGRLCLIGGIWLSGVATWVAIGPEENGTSKVDVAITLGAAIAGDQPSPVFRERINHAIELYRAGRVGKLLFTGGRVSPDVLSEAEVARNYAVASGIPAQNIVIETRSQTTRQNLLEARSVMEATDLKTSLLVSDPLHLRRALAMAEGLGMAAEASATQTTRYQSVSTQLPFLLRETYFVHHYWLFDQ